MPPFFTKGPDAKEVYVDTSTELELQCMAEGYPKPRCVDNWTSGVLGMENILNHGFATRPEVKWS